ncbi:hypothetical protein [Streptomyces sp. NPDC001165]|uniref:hypothetical protein n=1 Tax=Streptomyces sp. NPDC001165 TaxID=3364546 RepID=UPI0036AC3A03
MQCHATTVAHGDTHTCGKHAAHVDSADASRRVHHDFVTGVRWPSRLGGADPLAAFVRPVERDANRPVEEN